MAPLVSSGWVWRWKIVLLFYIIVFFSAAGWFAWAYATYQLGNWVWVILPLIMLACVKIAEVLDDVLILNTLVERMEEDVEKTDDEIMDEMRDIEIMESVKSNNKRVVVYVAGPLSSKWPLGSYFKMFRALRYGARLCKHGYSVIVPHASQLMTWFVKLSYEEWLDMDFELLTKCDVLLRIPGKSRGADAEVQIAKDNDIPVINSIKELIDNVPNTWWDFMVKFYPLQMKECWADDGIKVDIQS